METETILKIIRRILLGITLGALVYFTTSCKNGMTIETKRTYLNRVFMEETRNFQYYTQSFLDAHEISDIDLMDFYLDSMRMADYAQRRAFNDLRN